MSNAPTAVGALRTAGADHAALNATIDRFVAQALARDLPISVENLPGAPHSFDFAPPTPAAVAAVRRIVAFCRERLL